MPSLQSQLDCEELVLAHMPLVKKIAGSLYNRRSFDGVPFEEYVQFGAEGLIEAALRYDPSQGAKFETYASHRIKGAIVSGLEKSTEVNQQVSTLRRAARDRLASLTGELDAVAPPPPVEPASPQQALEKLVEVSLGLAIAFMLDDTALYQDGNSVSQWGDGAANLAYKQLQRKLNQSLEHLTAGERSVLERHYFEHDSFDLIAQTQGVTKGRISQVHRSALNKLRALLTVHHLGDLIG